MSNSYLFAFFGALTCSSQCALQGVSTPGSLAFLLCPDLFLPMCSSVGECLLLAYIHYSDVSSSMLSSLWVALHCSLSLAFLTCHFLCALQSVSGPSLLTFSCLPNLSLILCSSDSECPPLLAFFWCPDLFIYLHSPASECCLFALFAVLTCPLFCAL